jgi:hypothetical protein
MAVLRALRVQVESERMVLAFVFSVIVADCAVAAYSLLTS